MAGTRILLSVGDDSGDLHAANFMRSARELAPDVQFAGFGMARMTREGLEAFGGDEPDGSAMWLHNIARVGHFRRRLAVCRDHMDRERPDLVVPVDFGGFNLYLCREATARGLPVFYYIPPQVWAHGEYRIRKLRKWTARVGLIYPFERELYARHRVSAEYVGHPLFDELDRHPPSDEAVERLRRAHGPSLVGVFPGSRRQELRAHLPIILAACRQIRRAVPDVSFAALPAPGMRDVVRQALDEQRVGPEELALPEGVRPCELARASRLCITKSGTVTLELASQHAPMVIFYRASPLVAFLAYGLARTPFLGLINNLAGRMICPERAMARDEPHWVAEQAVRLLQDEAAWERCRRDISRALEDFAVPGASARAAASALALPPS